jgi:hypothetical protein
VNRPNQLRPVLVVLVVVILPWLLCVMPVVPLMFVDKPESSVKDVPWQPPIPDDHAGGEGE